MKNKLIILLLLTSCSEQTKYYNVVNNKYCISECRAHEFKSFHNEGKSWGTGSSSMNGLSQSEIYNVVTKECEKFYKDSECCYYNGDFLTINTIHSYYYGECRRSK